MMMLMVVTVIMGIIPMVKAGAAHATAKRLRP
jgi:hypothetical protein